MKNLQLEKKWENYNLSFYDSLNLYIAEEKRDYSQEDQDCKNGLIDPDGQWVYLCNENEYIGLKNIAYCSKPEEFLYKNINFWTVHENIGNEEAPIYKDQIYRYIDKRLIQIFAELTIIKATAIGPDKIVVGLLIDSENGKNQMLAVKILNTSNESIVDVITVKNISDSLLNYQIISHHIYGGNFLFSVKTYQNNSTSEKKYQLFNNDGKKMLDFDTVIGSGGEDTFFEPTKKGFGVVYRTLHNTIKIVENTLYETNINICECLIDCCGNYYGDFYRIQGTNPSIGAKSATKYPKFIEGKVLCLSLPENDTNPYLVLIDKEGKRINTEYQCPWVHTRLFTSCAFVSDKKYFGKKCLVVIDKNNMTQLIDFDGNLIEGVLPTKFENLWLRYNKYYSDQIK
jgi:hypothetical protein